MAQPADRSSGTLSASADTLEFRSPHESWSVALKDLKVIGACTTAAGPFLDDYFLVFVHRDGTLRIASFYADGRDGALDVISQYVGARIRPALANSAQWKSQTIWPASLADQPLVERTPSPVSGLIGRLRRALGLGGDDIVLSTPVREYIARLAATI